MLQKRKKKCRNNNKKLYKKIYVTKVNRCARRTDINKYVQKVLKVKKRTPSKVLEVPLPSSYNQGAVKSIRTLYVVLK